MEQIGQQRGGCWQTWKCVTAAASAVQKGRSPPHALRHLMTCSLVLHARPPRILAPINAHAAAAWGTRQAHGQRRRFGHQRRPRHRPHARHAAPARRRARAAGVAPEVERRSESAAGPDGGRVGSTSGARRRLQASLPASRAATHLGSVHFDAIGGAAADVRHEFGTWG